MTTHAIPYPHVDPVPVADVEGWRLVTRWAVGGAELLGVGLLVPLAILVVGTPIVLTVRLVLWMFGLA